ncbi:MAG: hypothetical protein DI622_18945 [Chryseobacterium sp.]|nr:MAG: hypothetical protein DI622_18945 [Chryseobacterium sp.]
MIFIEFLIGFYLKIQMMASRYLYYDLAGFIKTNFRRQKIEVTLHSLLIKKLEKLHVFSF